MTGYIDPELQAADNLPSEPLTGSEVRAAFAIGIFVLGSATMMMAGSFHFLVGLVALFNHDFYPVREGYDLKIDTTTWAWVHMIMGTVMTAVGALLLTGLAWVRIMALVIAILSAIFSFYSIPYYPVWSLIIIAVDLGLIWAIVAYGKELDME